jgi:hypothetical protein
VDKLRQWYSQHPKVEGNAQRGIRPIHCTDAYAMSLVFMVPLMPEVRNGCACKYSNQDDRSSPHSIEDHGSDNKLLDLVVREYVFVKEEKGHLQHRQRREVGNFAPVKESQILRYVVEWHCPNVLTQTIRQELDGDADGVWQQDEESQDDEEIVQAKS